MRGLKIFVRLRVSPSVAVLVLSFLFSLFISGNGTAGVATGLASDKDSTKTIVILQTSDIHGNLAPWNFFSGERAPQGLALVATLVERERKTDESVLLLDGGDTIQGSPLAYLYARKKTDEPNPMAVVMNAMGYAAMTVGNHEFNFGADVLARFRSQTNFPLLSANVRNRDGSDHFVPYLLADVQGVTVGILGLTTVGIPTWEKPEHIEGLRFDDAVETAKQYIPELKSKGATVILALVHAGTHLMPADSRDPDAWSSDPATWVERGASDAPEQNFVVALARACPDIDVIFSGHNHVIIPHSLINGVLIVEPGSFAQGVSRVELAIDAAGSVIEKSGSFISCEGIEADPRISALIEPYQSAAVAFVNEPIGIAADDFPGGTEARFQDGPLADFINTVQLAMARDAGHPADLSATAIFNDAGQFPRGPLTMADVYRVYQFENTLYVLEITGEMLRQAIEHAARFFTTVDPANPPHSVEDLLSGNVKPYNWDLFSGVDYQIDITKPPGQRVVELALKGIPVTAEQKMTLAVNNYRGGGGGGYTMFGDAKILWKSTSEIRDALAEYIRVRGTIHANDFYEQNWTLVPTLPLSLQTVAPQDVSKQQPSMLRLFFTLFASFIILVNVIIAVFLFQRARAASRKDPSSAETGEQS